MHESPTADETTERRAIRWDAIAAIIASLIGFLALLVGGYTAWVQRYTANIQLEQVRAQVWPYLAMGTSNAEGHYEVFIENKGVGPVIVQSVQVFVQGSAVTSWDRMMKLFAFKPKERYAQSPLNGIVLSPGDTRHWIRFLNAADAAEFLTDWEHYKVQVRICYSSSLGDNWLLVQGLGAPERPRTVPSCPKIPDSQQFSG